MPYATNTELPEGIRKHLPRHAQDIFRAAFNRSYARDGDDARAFGIAWSAVKRQYVQRSAGVWIRRTTQDWPCREDHSHRHAHDEPDDPDATKQCG